MKEILAIFYSNLILSTDGSEQINNFSCWEVGHHAMSKSEMILPLWYVEKCPTYINEKIHLFYTSSILLQLVNILNKHIYLSSAMLRSGDHGSSGSVSRAGQILVYLFIYLLQNLYQFTETKIFQRERDSFDFFL